MNMQMGEIYQLVLVAICTGSGYDPHGPASSWPAGIDYELPVANLTVPFVLQIVAAAANYQEALQIAP